MGRKLQTIAGGIRIITKNRSGRRPAAVLLGHNFRVKASEGLAIASIMGSARTITGGVRKNDGWPEGDFVKKIEQWTGENPGGGTKKLWSSPED